MCRLTAALLYARVCEIETSSDKSSGLRERGRNEGMKRSVCEREGGGGGGMCGVGGAQGLELIYLRSPPPPPPPPVISIY